MSYVIVLKVTTNIQLQKEKKTQKYNTNQV